MAPNWDNICNHDLDKLNTILNLLKLKKGDTIIDVGTGTGILLPLLSERIGKEGFIEAVDLSANMLEMAKKKNPCANINFIKGDINNVNLTYDQYDAIICYSVFPHFEDKQKLIARLSSILKKGGVLSICHSQSRDAINKLHKSGSSAISHDNLPSMVEIEQYILKSGLVIVNKIDDDQMFLINSVK